MLQNRDNSNILSPQTNQKANLAKNLDLKFISYEIHNHSISTIKSAPRLFKTCSTRTWISAHL